MIKAFLAALTATALGFASPVVDWGLGPNGQGVPPTPPSHGAMILEKHNGLYRQETDEKRVFFTFDLGYEAGYTAEVLDILKEHNIKAIFFLCGNYLKETDLVNRMIDEGHIIGNHTDRHKDLPTLSREGIVTDIMTFQNDFTTQFPKAAAPVWFRPPKGRIDEKTLAVASENNLKTMMWSIAIKDWGKTPINADQSSQTIIKRIHPGAIILFHITNAGMPRTIEKLIPMLEEQGYEIASHEKL